MLKNHSYLYNSIWVFDFHTSTIYPETCNSVGTVTPFHLTYLSTRVGVTPFHLTYLSTRVGNV